MLYLGSDHAGFKTKEAIKKYLESKNIAYKDLTPNNNKDDDYPDYAYKVAKLVSQNPRNKGILICGTGTGMVIAANKVKGIRAALAYDAYTAQKAREDNNANILALRGRNFPVKKAVQLVDIWLTTKFSNKARHKRRIKKIMQIENNEL